jgi:hypothetical protein
MSTAPQTEPLAAELSRMVSRLWANHHAATALGDRLADAGETKLADDMHDIAWRMRNTAKEIKRQMGRMRNGD